MTGLLVLGAGVGAAFFVGVLALGNKRRIRDAQTGDLDASPAPIFDLPEFAPIGQQIVASQPVINPVFTMSNSGLANLIRFEGSESRVYFDSAGLQTIGVGHLLTPAERATRSIFIDGEATFFESGLSNIEIDRLLRQDLVRFERAVNNVNATLNQGQFDVLVSLAFNIGVSAFEDSTLVKELEAGNFANVPKQISVWRIAGGRINAGLVNRRSQEVELWQQATV